MRFRNIQTKQRRKKQKATMRNVNALNWDLGKGKQ